MKTEETADAVMCVNCLTVTSALPQPESSAPVGFPRDVSTQAELGYQGDNGGQCLEPVMEDAGPTSGSTSLLRHTNWLFHPGASLEKKKQSVVRLQGWCLQVSRPAPSPPRSLFPFFPPLSSGGCCLLGPHTRLQSISAHHFAL